MDMMTRQKLKAWPNADWEQVEVLCGSMSNERASELTSRMQVIMMERVDEKLGAMAECTDKGQHRAGLLVNGVKDGGAVMLCSGGED